jgi:hypothetical protein
MLANVAKTCSSKERIGDCVCNRIGITVPHQRTLALKSDSTEDELLS